MLWEKGLILQALLLCRPSRRISFAYDAMTNDRPYRKAHSKEYAIKELLKYAGKQFDPILVEHFMKIVSKEGKASYKSVAVN